MVALDVAIATLTIMRLSWISKHQKTRPRSVVLSSPAQHWATTRLEEKVIGAILVQVDPARRNQFEPPASKPLSGRSASKRGTRWSTCLVLTNSCCLKRTRCLRWHPSFRCSVVTFCALSKATTWCAFCSSFFFLGLFCVLFQAHPSR